MKAISALLNYLIVGVQCRGGTPIKTQVVKLTYLVDMEFYRRVRKTATGLNWIFYHYGPYTSELEPILRRLPDIETEEFTSTKGRKGFAYKSEMDATDVREQLTQHFSSLVRSLADRVLDEWALVELWELLDYVYFETEPMKDAERGERLDFSKIISQVAPQEGARTPSPNVVSRMLTAADQSRSAMLDMQTLNRLRAIDDRQIKRKVAKPTPAPYDETYWTALDIMNDEDR